MSSNTGTLPPGSPGIVVVSVADPAAGAEWTQTVPDNVRWEILNIHVQYTGNATSISRYANIEITDGTDRLFFSNVGAIDMQSSTMDIDYGPGLEYRVGLATAQATHAPIPRGLTINAGSVIASVTLLLQATDQLENIRITVKEWVDVQ